MTHNTGAS